jgi:O-acetyl-ADP-ribose deacetylase (regulator of RNase III)
MTTKTVYGDIIQMGLDGELDVILQSCNCYNNMGKGLGLQMKLMIPEVYEVDCLTEKKDKTKLGTISYVTVDTPSGKPLTVVNCYTQYKYYDQKKKVLTQLWTIQPCMEQVKKLCTGKKIGYPMMGCGLGGGDWNQVQPIILDVLQGEDLTLVLLPE